MREDTCEAKEDGKPCALAAGYIKIVNNVTSKVGHFNYYKVFGSFLLKSNNFDKYKMKMLY